MFSNKIWTLFAVASIAFLIIANAGPAAAAVQYTLKISNPSGTALYVMYLHNGSLVRIQISGTSWQQAITSPDGHSMLSAAPPVNYLDPSRPAPLVPVTLTVWKNGVRVARSYGNGNRVTLTYK